MQKEFWKLSGNILFSTPRASAILVRKKRHSPSPRPSPLKGEGDQGKVLHGKKRHSPSPRPSPGKGMGLFTLTSSPLPSRERKIREVISYGEREIEETVFRRERESVR